MSQPILRDEASKSATQRTRLAAALAAIVVAFLASLCCIGPVIFVTLGIGAGLASRFEPLRPLFTVLTLALLAAGFYVVYDRRGAATTNTCTTDQQCANPRSRNRDTTVLWTATIIALLILTFPQWSLLLT